MWTNTWPRLSFFAALRIRTRPEHPFRHMQILRCAQNDRRGVGESPGSLRLWDALDIDDWHDQRCVIVEAQAHGSCLEAGEETVLVDEEVVDVAGGTGIG